MVHTEDAAKRNRRAPQGNPVCAMGAKTRPPGKARVTNQSAGGTVPLGGYSTSLNWSPCSLFDHEVGLLARRAPSEPVDVLD